MKPNVIELDEKGIFAYEKPDFYTIMPKRLMDDFSHMKEDRIIWNKALEKAKRDRVYFKDHVHVIEIVVKDNLLLEQGKSYPVPEGYEVKIFKDTVSNEEYTGGEPYAILVPKEKDFVHPTVRKWTQPSSLKKGAGDDYPIIVPKEKTVQEFDRFLVCAPAKTKRNKDRLVEKIKAAKELKQQSIEGISDDQIKEEAELSGEIVPVYNAGSFILEVTEQSIEEAAESECPCVGKDFRVEWIRGYVAGANHTVDELERWAKSHSPITPSALLNKLEQFKQKKL